MSFATLTAIAGGTSLLIVMLVAAGWLWIYLKTGSSHAPAMRVWRVLTGGREITDPEIRAYIEDQDSLMAFRLGSGINAKSVLGARRAIKFIAKHELSSDRLRQIGRYFDADKLQMRALPSVPYRVWLAFLAVVMAVIFFVAGSIATDQRILVSLKKTDSWFWLSPTSAQALSFPLRSGDRLSFSECSSPSSQHALPARDLETLCSIRKDPAFDAYLDETLKEQRFALLVLMIVSILASISHWREFIRVIVARDFEKELLKKLKAEENAAPNGPVASDGQE